MSNIGTDCIRSSSGFTSSTYYNVCTGTKIEVPNGTYDYMIGIPLFMIAVGVVVMIALGITSMFKSIFE